MRRIKRCAAVLIALFVCASAISLAQLTLPSSTLDRSGETVVIYRLPQGFTGHATLRIRWTDSLGRTVEDRTISSDLIDETEIPFHIDLSLAVAMKNHLQADLSLDGKDINGAPYKKQRTAQADFIARPPYTGWKDYVIIMWQQYPANLIRPLQQVGVDGGKYSARGEVLPDSLIDNNMRWCADGLAPDFYSDYHKFARDRRPGWYFNYTKDLYKKDPNSLSALKRHPSFWDPYWRRNIYDRGVASGKRFAPYRPYFYDLADETGVAELAAQWDFGFSDESLVPMRRWLHAVYGNLGALNQEWGTHFTDWNLVMPLTTNQAMKQPGNNFSQWADLKEWMDISYADALKLGTAAVREGDPDAYVSITGGQMPGWGGYDYARIVKAVTAIEPYDIGRSVDVIHSLNPRMPILSTSFQINPREKQRIWYELFHGNSGLIIWDQGFVDHHGGPDAKTPAKDPYVKEDGQASTIGKQAAGYFSEIRKGEGALIINSRLINNRIAIHYSQPSMRTQWMLERRPDGEAWMNRKPAYERTNNNFMRLRESWCDLIEDQGFQPEFISYMQVADGDLLRRGYHVLILPESNSLSQAEAKAIREFVAAGGVAIADGVPGTYDEHSKKLPQSSLADLFGEQPNGEVTVHAYGNGKAILLNADVLGYLQSRLKGTEMPVHQLIENLFRANGIDPQFAVEDAKGHSMVGTDVHIYANGAVRLIALSSNPQLRVDELGPPDFHNNDRFVKPTTVHLRLPRQMYLYDTRTGKALGARKELTVTVDPYEPTILAASDTQLADMEISVPDRAQRGSTVSVAVHAPFPLADVSIFHVDVRDPQGNPMIYYSGNLIAERGSGVKSFPLAVNDIAGKWTVSVRDILSGQTITRNIDVE